MSKLEFYLSKIVKYGLYAILLTPLTFWPKALYPFLTPKFILFQILVEIVFGAWFILQLIDSGNQSVLHRNYIAVALFGFWVVSFISALAGIDFSRSFWGIGARLTGLFGELHFFAWFLVLVSHFSAQGGSASGGKNNKEEWNKYLNFSFIIALVVALTSFYQNPKWALAFGYGVFNNPTFVAPYLIFHFFWGLYQTLNYKLQITNYKRWFYGAGTVLLLSVILFTQIRGAILGLLIGIFALGIGLILSGVLSRRSRIILSAFYVLLIAGLVAFWQLRNNQFIQSFSPIKRVTGISLFETTVQTRLLAWQVALKGFTDRPFFGTGPENFNYVFNKNYNPQFLKFGGGGFGETWFDKPHNAFLEILSETGIIGSLAYVFIWAAVSLALYKLFRRGEKFLSLILASAFIAYFSAVFFSFDSFGSWFGLYLMLGFLASLTNTNVTNQHTNNTNVNQKFIKIFVSFVCLFVLLVLLSVNYSIWRANAADADALRTFPKNTEQGIALFKKSLNYFTPYKAEYRLDLFTVVGSVIQTNHSLPNPEETINFVLAEADKIIVDHPKDATYYTNLVKLYDILGEKGRDPQILKIAQSYGEKSLALSPNRQETLFYLTKNSLLEGDTKSAVSYMIQAVNAEPSINMSHWYLGLAYVADNQKEKGMAEIKKALGLGYNPQNKAEEDFIKSLGL